MSAISIPSLPITQPLPLSQWPGHWYLIHSKPQKERSLAAELSSRSIRYFLPSQETKRIYTHANGREERRSFNELLWPGYLFFCGDDNDRHEAGISRFRNSIESIKNQKRLVRELELFHQAIVNQIRIGAPSHWQVGQHVRIGPNHPLFGSKGTVDKAMPGVVFLSLWMFGQRWPVEIEDRFVEME